jgi:hypothetical protein
METWGRRPGAAIWFAWRCDRSRRRRWKAALRFTEFELRQIAAVGNELDAECQATITPPARSSQPRVSSKNAP